MVGIMRTTRSARFTRSPHTSFIHPTAIHTQVAALLDETTGRVAELRAERERLRQVDADNQAEAETKSKQIEKILNKRALLIEAQNDASRKVGDSLQRI